jgi:rubredoxin
MEKACGSKFVCTVCGYEYNPAAIDPEGNIRSPFNDLPDNWVCPSCGAGKEKFKEKKIN